MVGPLAFIPLLPCLANLFILAYVWGQRRKTPVNHAYLLFSFFIFNVSLLEFLTHLSVTGELKTLFIKLIGPLVLPLGFLFLNFIYALVNKKKDILYWISFCLAIITICISLFIEHTEIILPKGSTYNLGIIHNSFLLLFTIGTEIPGVYGIWLCFSTMLKEKGTVIALQLRLLLIGAAISTVWAGITLMALPKIWGIQQATLLTSLGLLFNTYCTYRAVSRYYMLSVNVTQLEESFRMLFQNIDEAVIFFDQYGNIAQINSGVYNLFDIERSECTKNFLQSAIEGYRYDKEYTNHRFTYTKDSDQRYLLLSQSSIGDGNSALGKILLIRDITEQIESENELHRSQNLESLGQLAAGIAHDFNNYLAGITTCFSLARMEMQQHSELADIFAEGEKAALEASSLTRQLLTFSRGGAPVKETFAICDTLKGVGIFSTRGSNVKLQLDFPQNSPVINADKGQISQVFQNLILNAVQAMPQGGTITIGIKVYRSGKVANLKPGHYVAITVKDHGHGIPQDSITKIFDPYFTTKQKGSGLGLTTVFSIIKKHDGNITVSSSLGKGTAFTVYLPTTQEVKKKKKTPATRPILHDKGRILIMDDEAVVRKLLDKLLQRFGFEVDIAANGEEALDRFEKRRTNKETYTAVITDLTVSGAMGGLQLTKELLKRDPSLKIIISSGYSEDEVISKHKKFGFFSAIRKPFSIDELTAVLNSISQD